MRLVLFAVYLFLVASIAPVDLCDGTELKKLHPDVQPIIEKICKKDASIFSEIRRTTFLEYLGEPLELNLKNRKEKAFVGAVLWDTKLFQQEAPTELKGAISFAESLRIALPNSARYGLLTKGYKETNFSFEIKDFAYEITLLVKGKKTAIISFRIFPKSKI